MKRQFLTILIFAVSIVLLDAQIVYVTPAGSGTKDGSSWANAMDGNGAAGNGYTKLANATQTAVSGKQFWVAEGTYLPATDNDIGRWFRYNQNTAILGGFSGNETHADQREIEQHPTILSGDIGVAGVLSDNSIHVVSSDFYGDNWLLPAVIDGVVITGGNATVSGSNANCGGGIYVNTGRTLIFKNSKLVNNMCQFGGALFSRGKCTIINCIIANNKVGVGSSPYSAADNYYLELFNTTLVNNDQAVYTSTTGTSYLFENCIIYGNESIFNQIFPKIVVNYCNFQGGLYGSQNQNPLFVNPSAGSGITFSGLTADWHLQPGSPCVDYGNTPCLPLGIFTDLANHKRIYGNSIDAGAYEQNSLLLYSPIINRVPATNLVAGSITQNSATFQWTRGNGDDCLVMLSETISNSEIAKINGLSFIPNSNFRQGEYFMQNNIVWFCMYKGTGNSIAVDGLSPGRMYRVSVYERFEDSLCTVPAVVNFTTSGTPGAGQTFYVTAQGGLSVKDGRTWQTAFSSPQPGLALAHKGDQVWVATGTYRPTNDFTRYFSFNLMEGVDIFGGFNGTENSPAERNIPANPTILNGNIGLPNDSLDNSYHVVYAPPSATPWTDTTFVDGIMITGGVANIPCSALADDKVVGGGMAVSTNCLVKMTHCKIYDNSGVGLTSTNSSNASLGGGGIYNKGTLLIQDDEISGNCVVYPGGGVFNAGKMELKNSVINNNKVTFPGGGWYDVWGGGGLYNYLTGVMTVDSCEITNNNAPNNLHGGGVYNRGKMVLKNSLVANNVTARDGGGAYSPGPFKVYNTHFTHNTSAYLGGAIYASDSLTVDSCLFDFNAAHNSPNIYTGGYGVITNTEISHGRSTGQAGFAGGINSYGKTRVANCDIHSHNLHGIQIVITGGVFNFVYVFSGSDGGGILHQGDTLWVDNCSIYNNLSGGGGGVAVYTGNAFISNSKIVDNFCAYGAAICNKAKTTVTNCLIANNTYYNGGLFQNVGNATTKVINSTISNNWLLSTMNGNSVFVHGEFQHYTPNHFKVANCIVNSPTTIFGYYPATTGTDSVSYSMVTGGYTGPGNISADPLFVNPTAGNDTTYNALLANWTLSACSPCIDSGADSLCNKPLDLEGNPRKFHRIDMGAYELKYDNSVVATNHSNTGRTITTLRWKSSIKPCHTLVFLKDTLTGSPAPAGGTIYTPNTVYGSGTNLDGWFCIYNGQDTTVSVTNLNEGTTYRLAVFNYILDSLYDAPGLMNFNTERTTLGDITKTYGDADFILQAQSFSGISAHTYTIDFDTIATITNDTASLAGAGTATITVRHNGNTEYLSDSTTAGLTVNKALLLVEAADTSRMAGLENPVFRLTYNGFAYDEDTTALIAVPTAFSPANLNSPPGQYPIIPSGGMAENYEISYLDGILTVEINTAIQSVQSQTGLRIYPVPTSDIVHIEALNDHKISQVNLYNLTGNQVLKINTADRQNPDISLKNLPAGDYMMEVNIEGECVRVKVMKR